MARYWLIPEGALNIDTGEIVAVSSINPDDIWSNPPANPVADRLAWLLNEATLNKRAQARAWLTAINGRAYEHAGNSEDFDDVIIGIRTGCRNMVNNWAIEAGLAPRVSAVEAKTAFATAAAPFDLIDKAKQGKVLMVAAIEALTDVASINSYQVSDATAAALWVAANPAVTPTLGQLLADYPIRV